jgi:epsin
MLDIRLNDKGKNWRHVFKVCLSLNEDSVYIANTLQSLMTVDHCLRVGSKNLCIYFQDNIYIIKSLSEFQYVDEDGKDQGANVRQKAIDITNLLRDERRLREERL